MPLTPPEFLVQRSKPIEQIDGSSIDPDHFASHLNARQPLLIVGGASTWPAMERWSFDFFVTCGGTTPVVLEYGNVMQRTTRYKLSTLAKYVEAIHESKDPDGEHPYLSVFKLFEVMPELRKDVDFKFLTAHRAVHFLQAWLGPAGTVTGLHADYPDNVLAQIQGRKLVHLISPKESQKVYPSDKYEYGIRMSAVDFQHYDSTRWPLVQSVAIRQALLAPGDLLFIPGGWWHHVMSLTPSISINCFAVSWGTFLQRESFELLRAGLHNLGLLGRDCTCHGILDGRRVSRQKLIHRTLHTLNS